MFKPSSKNVLFPGLALVLLFSLSACGGGGSSGGGDQSIPVPVATGVTGFASAGSPLNNSEVMIIGANGSGSLRTTTGADGRYNVPDVGLLEYPLRIEVADKSLGQARTLRSIAVRGQRIAHVTPATDAITRLAPASPTATELLRLSGLLLSGLQAYTDAGQSSNLISDASFRPDSTGIDGVFDLVDITARNGRLVLQSRINPVLRRELAPEANTTNDPLPRVPSNAAIDPVALRNLVNAFNQVLVNGNLAASSFRDVFHPDFQDNEGRTASDFGVAFSNSSQLRVNGFQILRCFADGAGLFDRCHVRLKLARPLSDFNEDFNNPSFAGLVSNEAYDLVVERRDLMTSPLRFAGGTFKPFAGSLTLAYTRDSVVDNTGSSSLPSPPSAAVSLNVPVAAEGTQLASPAELYNSNVIAAELVQSTPSGGSSSLLRLVKPGAMECVGRARKLVRNPNAVQEDCGNAVVSAFVPTLTDSARQGELGVDFFERVGASQNVRGVRVLRINEPEVVEPTFFPSLDRLSLSNLSAFAKSTTVRNVVITLDPPFGFPNVCIVAQSFDKPVCVRSQRRISLTEDQLARSGAYIVFATDREGNRFQTRYVLP